MKCPSFEVRLPRATATKTLVRICERLDACPSGDKNKVCEFTGKPLGVVTAKRLWVVGTYARGALTCGDIDLVMEVDNHQYFTSEVNGLLLKNPRRVRLYLGTPDDNSSRAEFEEAVLIWEAGKDWRAALTSIREDASATRFARPHDRIPLRLEQLAGSNLDWAGQMVTLHDRKELNWSYVPLDEISELVEEDSQTADTTQLYHCAQYSGTNVKKLLPYLLAFVRRFGPANRPWSKEATTFTKGSTLFVVGTAPSVDALLDPGLSKVVVIPHLSTRGPNGFWVIERGPNHPLVTAFEHCEAWAVADEEGGPIIIHAFSLNTSFDGSVTAVEIFQVEKDAVDCAASQDECDPLEAGKLRQIRHITGAALLDLLAQCDMLLGSSEMVFSQDGWLRAKLAGFRKEELERCTAEELAALFRPPAGNDVNIARPPTQVGGVSGQCR